MENVTVNNAPGEPKSGGSGAIIGVIIIIILIVAGGWYFIGNRVEQVQEQKEAAKTLELSTGTSTEVGDIADDLKNLDVNSLNN
jgi:uncharacterized protein HemX